MEEKNSEISWKALEENLFSALDRLAPMLEMKVSQNHQETGYLIQKKNSFLKKAH